MSLIEQLKRHEGLVLKPYQCTAGKLTIGYGRNLEAKGISEAEAEAMLLSDVKATQDELTKRLPVYTRLSQKRQDVLTNMAFNLGVNGLLKFKKMISALEVSDFKAASKEMLNSNWAKQVGGRAIELSEQMK